jgi:dihydroorotate dehydrogenase electron transfer subunit
VRSVADRARRGPGRVDGEVLLVKTSGAYVHLTLLADAVAERARPGTFVTLAVGGEPSALLLPRPFWIHRARPAGTYGGTVEVVFSERGPATRWLAGLRPGDRLTVTGPLGRPFALPKEPVSCALLGYGASTAPLFMLAEALRERDCAVHLVLAAASESSVFGGLEGRRTSNSVTVATTDGPGAARTSVVDSLRSVVRQQGVEVVFGAGPGWVLREVAAVAAAAGAYSQLAVEAPMGCGFGVCGSCVLPVKDDEDVTRPVRCCVEGPVFAGDRLDWALLEAQWT